MAELSAFLPFIMPHTINALEPSVFQALRATAKEFCQRTRCWREVFVQDIEETTEQIAAVPAGANLFELDQAFLGSRLLEPAPYPEIEWTREPGVAHYISCISGNQFVVSPPEAGSLRMVMFLEPSLDCEDLPDMLLNDHCEALANGTIARLCLLPNQPYTDPGKAAMHQALYMENINRNFANNIRGKQRARLKSKPRYF